MAQHLAQLVLILFGLLTVGCGSLPSAQLDCLSSPNHTLELAKTSVTGYRCTKADRCGLDFIQSEPDIEACNAKPGCEFFPGKCFCGPLDHCICGGGPPLQCRKKVTESTPSTKSIAVLMLPNRLPVVPSKNLSLQPCWQCLTTQVV